MNKPVVGGRLVRWLLLLQEFDIAIVDKPSKANVVADFLSRLPTTSKGVVDDSFPAEHLFGLTIYNPWNDDIVTT